ncbi:MAG: peptidylprolyl isomerase [Candidatus Aerophobetes bacterium]|nr:peptidylprolyl isomerase [Candidatus Aerophobetes bacterium]
MPIKKGDKVKLHLSGKLKDGRVFATTEGKEPVEVKAGVGEILPGIDEELIGMKKDEKKKITLPPEKGFGKRKGGLVRGVPKGAFKGKKVEAGQKISVQTQQGRTMSAQVTKIEEDKVTLDLNHPLAGKETTFDIKVMDIE